MTTPTAGGWLVVAVRQPYFHLELHGLDLADAEHDGYAPALCRRQPELRTSLALERDRLRSLLRGRGPTTRLRDLADALGAS